MTHASGLKPLQTYAKSMQKYTVTHAKQVQRKLDKVPSGARLPPTSATASFL